MPMMVQNWAVLLRFWSGFGGMESRDKWERKGA